MWQPALRAPWGTRASSKRSAASSRLISSTQSCWGMQFSGSIRRKTRTIAEKTERRKWAAKRSITCIHTSEHSLQETLLPDVPAADGKFVDVFSTWSRKTFHFRAAKVVWPKGVHVVGTWSRRGYSMRSSILRAWLSFTVRQLTFLKEERSLLQRSSLSPHGFPLQQRRR